MEIYLGSANFNILFQTGVSQLSQVYSLTVTVMVFPFGSSNLSMVVILASMVIPKNRIVTMIRVMMIPIHIGIVKNSTQSQTSLENV